jgi:hypothetical protein
MKTGFLALMILLTIPTFAKAQDIGVLEAHPFKISSLNTAFAMQGDFEGEYRIYPNWIEIKLTKTDIHISEHCPYQGRRVLSSLTFGLATTTENNRWKIAHAGNEIHPRLVLYPGDKQSLGEHVFYLPINDSIDLSKHWLVVKMEDNVPDHPEKEVKGYAYAHSCRDLFSQKRDKCRPLPNSDTP